MNRTKIKREKKKYIYVVWMNEFGLYVNCTWSITSCTHDFTVAQNGKRIQDKL